MQNSFQKPLFAPVSQGSQLGEDIDLNEIFADYFINEFEDPLNAYTSSMANYSGAAAAVALAQQKQQLLNATQVAQTIPQAVAPADAQQPPAVLPTGGIKAPFHARVAGATEEPAQKKLKESGSAVVHAPVPISQTPAPISQTPVPQPQALVAVAAPPTAGRGAIAGRLGFSVVGGQVALPQRGVPQQSPISAPPPPPPPKQQGGATNVPLPVGVGIRLGGVGGVAPSTAQAAPRGTTQYAMWGGPSAAGAMTEQAVAERRQRNREHAKRSRVRKKFMLESLQEQVRALQKENVELRMLIQQKIPQHSQKIIADCCSKNPLFSDPDATMEAETDDKKETKLVRSDFSLIESLTSGQQNFVLSDPRLPDNPIVYASPGFYTLTGYAQDQVLGRNCRFLQGPGTDPRAVDIVRTAIANGSDTTTCLLNYKADGTPFWNQFFVAALRDSDNCIVNFVGVQCEVEPEAGSSALEDKVNSVLPLQNKEGEEKAGNHQT